MNQLNLATAAEFNANLSLLNREPLHRESAASGTTVTAVPHPKPRKANFRVFHIKRLY